MTDDKYNDFRSSKYHNYWHKIYNKRLATLKLIREFGECIKG